MHHLDSLLSKSILQPSGWTNLSFTPTHVRFYYYIHFKLYSYAHVVNDIVWGNLTTYACTHYYLFMLDIFAIFLILPNSATMLQSINYN